MSSQVHTSAGCQGRDWSPAIVSLSSAVFSLLHYDASREIFNWNVLIKKKK